MLPVDKLPLDYGRPAPRKHRVTTIAFWIVTLPLLCILLLSFIGRLVGN